MILLSISIFWLSVCVDSISADPHITVEAHVGSTALLPCNLSKVFTQTSVRWRTDNEVVFERSFNGTHEGPGYEGRVDVPEDELRKGNCSLVLKDVRVTDHAFYKSLMVVHVEATNAKKTEISKVQLDVFQSVSAQVGSTAVLPCDWRHLSIQTPHVEWSIGDETVFERLGKGSFQGKGYEGHVDVPEEELLKGNCSLVLKNVSVTDETRYSSYIVVKNINKLVQNFKLSVSEKSEERKDDPSAPSDEADGMNLLIIITVCIMCSVLLIFIAVLIWRKYQCNFTICRDSSDLRSCSSQNNRNEEDLSLSPLNQQANKCEVQENISD